MEILTKYSRYINRIKKLIVKNGYREPKLFFERRQKLKIAFEKVDLFIREHSSEAKVVLKRCNRRLYRNKLAYQQFIFFVRILKLDKNLWKEFFPCLVFGRLTEKHLGNIQRWHAPKKKKEQKNPKQKTVKTLPYLLAGKKILEESLETDQFPKIIKKIRKNVPFGSPLFLKNSLINYQKKEEKRKKLEKEKEKLEHCAWCKIGKGDKERMSKQRFCKKNQNYLKQFRHPALKQKNLKTEELNKLIGTSS